jgi:hypothetical protein
MSWATFETWSDDGEMTLALDVAPVIDVGGEQHLSAAHILGPKCPCRPRRDTTKHRVTIYMHHDPDHPGAMSEEEFAKQGELVPLVQRVAQSLL